MDKVFSTDTEGCWELKLIDLLTMLSGRGGDLGGSIVVFQCCVP